MDQARTEQLQTVIESLGRYTCVLVSEFGVRTDATIIGMFETFDTKWLEVLTSDHPSLVVVDVRDVADVLPR